MLPRLRVRSSRRHRHTARSSGSGAPLVCSRWPWARLYSLRCRPSRLISGNVSPASDDLFRLGMCACPYLSRGFSIPSMYLGTLVVCLDSLNAYPTHSKHSGALASQVPLRVLRVAARHSVDIRDFFRNLEHFVHSAVTTLSAASCSHLHGSPSTGLRGIVHRSCGRPSCRIIDPSAHSALTSNISIFHRLR